MTAKAGGCARVEVDEEGAQRLPGQQAVVAYCHRADALPLRGNQTPGHQLTTLYVLNAYRHAASACNARVRNGCRRRNGKGGGTLTGAHAVLSILW